MMAACGPLGATVGPLIGGTLYQITPVLPYAFASVMLVTLVTTLRWLDKRVKTNSKYLYHKGENS